MSVQTTVGICIIVCFLGVDLSSMSYYVIIVTYLLACDNCFVTHTECFYLISKYCIWVRSNQTWFVIFWRKNCFKDKLITTIVEWFQNYWDKLKTQYLPTWTSVTVDTLLTQFEHFFDRSTYKGQKMDNFSWHPEKLFLK